MEERQINQFPFYDFYAEILNGLTDEEAGRMAKKMCEYMFTDSPVAEITDGKERFYWGNLVMDEIYYVFDPVSKTLNRHSSIYGETKFKGMESIEFGLYYHPLEENVPLLLVSMIIQTTESHETKMLPLTTTICSSIVNKDLVNLDWNSTKK